jgi:hypothetical protein
MLNERMNANLQIGSRWYGAVLSLKLKTKTYVSFSSQMLSHHVNKGLSITMANSYFLDGSKSTPQTK